MPPRPRPRVAAPWNLQVLLLVVAGCAVARLPPPREGLVRDSSGVLIPTHQLAVRPFSVVQRVSGKQGTKDLAFECVVRLAGGKLTVSGITLHSTRAFSIEQRGADVNTESGALRDVPFEPLHVLYDIHRVFFRGIGRVQGDGMHERVVDDELVRERWENGQLVERTFHAVHTFAKLIVISFEGTPAPVIAPRVRLTNLRYSYALEIENTRQERLDEGFTLDVEKSIAGSGP